MATLSATKDDTHATPVPPLKRRKRVVTPEMATSSTTALLNVDNFQDLKAPPSELRPSATLTTGQCFHWKVVEKDETKDIPSSAWGTHNATEWVGTLRTREGMSLVVGIRETPDTTLYRVIKAPGSLNIQSFLRDYFQLDQPLEALYSAWSAQDNRLGRIAKCIPGVRIINQDPWECLVSFICSSNNNIPRITKMLAAIRREYGQPLVREGEHEDILETLYSFPSLQELKEKANEQDLRDKCVK
jgi:N-glycosylase/DNA lyase